MWRENEWARPSAGLVRPAGRARAGSLLARTLVRLRQPLLAEEALDADARAVVLHEREGAAKGTGVRAVGAAVGSETAPARWPQALELAARGARRVPSLQRAGRRAHVALRTGERRRETAVSLWSAARSLQTGAHAVDSLLVDEQLGAPDEQLAQRAHTL